MLFATRILTPCVRHLWSAAVWKTVANSEKERPTNQGSERELEFIGASRVRRFLFLGLTKLFAMLSNDLQLASWFAPPLSSRGQLRATRFAIGMRSELSAGGGHGAIERYGFKGSEAVLVSRYIFAHGPSDVGTT